MNSKNRAIVIAILVTLCVTVVLTLLAWHKVAQLEDELAIQKLDVYMMKLVQEELLKQHNLHLEDNHPVLNKIEQIAE